jgi:hypothetical protein
MSSRQISDLCEELQPVATQFLAECNGDFLFKKRNATVFLTCTYRSEEEQDFEYAKGRTSKGIPCLCGHKHNPIGTCQKHPLGLTVTKAKAGESPHNVTLHGKPYAMAFDFAIDDATDGDCDWVGIDSLFTRAASIGQSLGLRSGITWGDAPHLELRDWKERRQ